jgi:MOSC domain-containing protein YiiM
MQLPLPALDPSAHLSFTELERRFSDLSPAPRDQGKVTLLIARAGDSTRTLHERAILTPQEGMPGDRWISKLPLNPDAQITVISHRIAALIGNGQHPALFGDNLVIDLDLSEASLPVGSRLRVGEALCEVTPKPHTGCLKYAARFGDEALRFISTPAQKPLRLRGIYLRVLEAGAVWTGADAVVLSRASQPDSAPATSR